MFDLSRTPAAQLLVYREQVMAELRDGKVAVQVGVTVQAVTSGLAASVHTVTAS